MAGVDEEHRRACMEKMTPTSSRHRCIKSTRLRSETEREKSLLPSHNRLRSGRSGRGLLAQDWLAHDSVLAGHPPAQRALHLGSESQFVQVIGLLGGGHKALGLQGLVLQALQAVTQVMDVGDSGVSAR